ncbi:cytochrome P450 2J2-like isoform X1 [Sphaerodactylus townsendi]|uniref:cytochrome P450 2J2-like isoform X1 n=1 Tax=Sphaerodactylus townsendi TaxID=933632 RepID=UPI0020273A53|nr:cytochrome P450 2J2-like isoform X1 [Sphaerodactylus townsendi]
MERQIEEEANQLVETFVHAKGQPLDPASYIRNSVTNVISAVTFGHLFSVEDKEFLQIVEAVQIILKFSASIVYVLYELFPRLMNHLPGPHKKAFSCLAVMNSFAKKEIEKHKENQAWHDPQDFIDFYLHQMEKSKKDPASTYNEENLVQCIIDLFIAGSDTTANTLHWALLFMANHPDIQEKVHKEIKDVLGSVQSLSYQDKKKLPYTNAVIQEVQRAQYILLFGVSRQCAKDVNMFHFLIPKGTFVIPDIYSVLHDPIHWETPEAFNPNHFLDKDGLFVENEAFLPFGAGARICPGEQLARIELFIFFTSLMRAFKFQLPDGVKELSEEPIFGFTTPPHPYKLCAVPRCNT